MNISKSEFRKNIFYLSLVLSVLPFLFFFFIDVEGLDFIQKLANLSGFIGAVFLIWQFALGVRAFSKRITSDYDWVIKIHTFFGIFGTSFVFVHPILENIIYGFGLFSLFDLDFSNTFQTYLSFGKISFIFFLIVWFSSAILRKTLSYRNWLYVHYMSYLMLFFMLLHPFQIGTILNSNLFVYYYWLFLMSVTILIAIIKVLDIFNVTNKKYAVTKINKFPGDTYTIHYLPVTKEKIIPLVGQYFYIKVEFIGEAHPFSILEFNEETGELVFGFKVFGKHTEKLSNTRVGEIHYLDGPFGEFTFEGHNDEPKVILAGGIGITPFYELVKRYGNEDTYLLYANKKLDFALFRDKFKRLLGNNYFDFISEEKLTGKNIVCDFINLNHVKNIFTNKDLKDFKYFICGSPIFTKNTIQCLSDAGIKRNQIYIEEFEY